MPYIGSDPSNRFVAPKAASVFSGDGSTTAFTLDHAVGSDEDILVSVDGVIQEPSVAYAVSSGTILTFTAAPSSNSGNNIFVYYLFRTVATVDHPSTSALTATSGTFTGNATVSGTLGVTGTQTNNGNFVVSKATPNVDIKDTGTAQASMDFLSNSDTVRATIGMERSAGGGLFVGSSAYAAVFGTASSGNTEFATNNNIRMTIDSAGVVMVGTTDDDPVFNNANGASIGSNNGSALAGVGQFSCSGGVAVRANRSNEEGACIGIHSEGTQEGIIGIKDAQPFMSNNGGTNNCGIRIANNALIPCNNIGAVSDNNVDLGAGDARYDDVFATNTSITTSDKNEKQDIEELSEAEKKVAVACKSLLRKYKWKKAVTEKGDKARTHFGIIAQDLEDAFIAEGLDASKYGMFCSDTWTDIDGKEQTRLGVRYSELLAFIISAI